MRHPSRQTARLKRRLSKLKTDWGDAAVCRDALERFGEPGLFHTRADFARALEVVLAGADTDRRRR